MVKTRRALMRMARMSGDGNASGNRAASSTVDAIRVPSAAGSADDSIAGQVDGRPDVTPSSG
ncbi:MAG: hypothetical protein WA979_09300 [Pacificimonas sp.]